MTSRSVEETRRALLEAAYGEIHRQGFQAASLSAILQKAGVTKGALYHYFDSKKALGYAVLDEWIHPFLQRTWIEPLNDPGMPPLERLTQTISQAARQLTEDDIRLGCPVNNLAQEMSPIDEGFRRRIDTFYQEWQRSIARTLAEGQDNGTLSNDFEAEATALFIIAALEGCLSIAKTAQSRAALLKCGNGVFGYLQSLRSGSTGAHAKAIARNKP